MKLTTLALAASLLAVSSSAADLSQVIAEASRYESGVNAEPLRQIEKAVRESAGHPGQRAEVEAALVKMLAPACAFEARRFACTQLAIIGTASSLSAIAELLNDPETVGIACLALGSNPSPKVNGFLRAKLPSTSSTAGVQIIVTLGNRGDAAAVKALADLTRSTDPAIAEAAIGSLGMIASSEALAGLDLLRHDSNPEKARAASMASLVAADHAAQRGSRTAATTIYEQLLAASQPVNVRRAALEGLFRLDNDKGEQRVLAVLRGSDSVLKPSAIARVRALNSSGVSRRFAKEMATLAPSEQVQMIEALASRQDAAARATITGQVSAENASVRRAAVIALASVGDAKSVPVLANALNRASDVEEQQTIELALASLKGGDDVDKQIAALLQTKTSLHKPILINVLARRGSRTSIPPLLSAADSTEAGVARAAFRALGKLANAAELPTLLDKLVNLKVSEARSEAEGAVTKVISKTTDTDRRYAAVSGALARTTDVETRCSLIGFFPTCGGSKALGAVKVARSDQDPRVREAALRALAAWPDASAIALLVQIVQSATANTEREVALRGCVYLLESANEDSTPEVAALFEKVTPLAKNANEKKLVVSGLAKVHDRLALKLLEPFLSDPDVQAEAAQAVVSLAPHLCGAFREATRSALQKVTDLPVSEELKKPARELLAEIGQFGDFITAWQVTGPFSQEGKNGKALFDIPFSPEQPDAPGIKWQVIPAGGSKARPWQLDLGKLYSGDNRVAYARSWIYSQAQQPARLELGSDDGIKAWLNGQVVVAANRGGDAAPGTEKAAVTLQQGWNKVLLKVTQWTSGWGFCARMAKPDGSTLEGLRVEGQPPK